MELIRGLHNLREHHHGSVVTIGNFDGVHLGHRAILSQLSQFGEEQGVPTVLVTFEPQPQEFFARADAPPRLTRFREKLLSLRSTSVDRVLMLRFDHELSRMLPTDFVLELLIGHLGARVILAGEDFRFGRDAFGNLALLQELGRKHAFEVVRRDTFNQAGGRVSSSWIRDALANGELELAAGLLGRPYAMSGRVRRGQQLGRTIGYPTANIFPLRNACPLSGIYVVTLAGLTDQPLPGVASVGTRPTVNGKDVILEVHLFDFDQDIYGRMVEVEFRKKLRDELRFDSVEEMTHQIDKDADQAREYFLH